VGGSKSGDVQLRSKLAGRQTAVVLAALFALLSLSASFAFASAADDPSESADAATLSAALESPDGPELPSERTATSQTFALSDGTRETRIYEAPIHYRNAEDEWKPIDEDLEALNGKALTNGANSFDIHLPLDLDEAPVRVTQGEEWVSEIPLGVQTAAVELEDDGTASYSAAGGSADFEFTGLANGLKESIELAGPDAPSTYRFQVDTSAGVAPELVEDGSIAFRDPDEELVAEMPAPFMVDSAGTMAPLDAIHYSLEDGVEGAWRLAVEADPEWLQAPERSWPVVIDPSVTVPSPTKNCIIATTTESKMCGSSGYGSLAAKANYLASGENQYARTLMQFNLSTIPKGMSLISATLGLYSPKAATNVTKVDLYDVNRSWENTVTWKYASGSQKWTKEGGDYGNQMHYPTSLTPADRGGSQVGWWNFSSPNLTGLVEKWVEGSASNYGLLLKLADETPRVCCIERQVEWESSAGTNKPYLAVQYIPAASADSNVTSPTDGTMTAKRFRLEAAWDHSGVDHVSFQYKTSTTDKEEGRWTEIPESQVIDAGGKTVDWPVEVKAADRKSPTFYWDASSLTGSKAGAKVPIRAVLAGDPGADGYTKPVQGEVDKEAGGFKDEAVGVGPGSVNLLTGNFTVSRNDVSIRAYASALEFSRSISSRVGLDTEADGVLGPGWNPASPLETAGGSAWRQLIIREETEDFEGESVTYKWAELIHSDGHQLSFEETEGKFITPPEASGNVLYRLPSGEIAFTDPDGNRTVFSNNGTGSEYLPISVAQTGGPGNKGRMIYEVVGTNTRRLKQVIAPAAPGITCPDETADTTDGCNALRFTYQSATTWGAPASAGARLSEITYYAPGRGDPQGVERYSYDNQGRLIAAWDPRISPNLKETYTYEAGGQIATLTPPGQQPWTMQYGKLAGETSGGRLIAVKRATLVESKPTAQTTIAYGVPLSSTTGPYAMEPKDVATWGQTDVPTDATAIFGPDEVPSSPPSSWTRATVYYMDAEGQAVNIATPPGAGTSAPSITTTETDRSGNLVRELSAQNRLRALSQATAEARVAKSRELDTQLHYSTDGSELQEEIGPMHQVRLESGTTTQARLLRTIQYDDKAPTPAAGYPMPQVATSETTGVLLGNGSVTDKRSTVYGYNWNLRRHTETIADPGGSEETKSVTVYDPSSGQPTEFRQPKDAGDPKAGTTKIVYYQAESGEIGPCEDSAYAGLPCKVEPGAQPGTPGQPQLLVKKFLAYNRPSQPLEITESPGGGSENVRKTILTYDAAGRRKTRQITGGGVAVPKTESLYSTSLGAPNAQHFVCPESEPGCDTQETSVIYDTLGRATSYKDADGNTATTTYDFLGRPMTTNDGKGTQTFRYDSVTGLLTELEDSAAGLFTASYDADGQLVKRGLPNGLTAETTYDETGAPVALNYTKTSSCGASCTWLNFTVERSIRGQILLENGTLGKDEYGYDKLGRLTSARETPTGGSCTTRSYKYDKDSNREEMTATPGVGGVCSSSGGTTKKYAYDAADRLLAEGLTYDHFGRIAGLPGSLAGGKALTTEYFSNDMVAMQSQNGVTNTFQLDATLRQRQRLQAGGLEGTEVFHYAGSGDSPSWTQRGSAWTRNILGIGGELAALQESGKEITLPLTNLHGDVVATAAINPEVTTLKGTFAYDEFGNLTSGTPGRFGWLGGMQRRTELPSGVVQMGARSYVPAIGRFLSSDPIAGGSANAYDYGNADPVNQFDPSGMKPADNDCDPGIAPYTCQVWLHIRMWSPARGRMGVRMIYGSNRVGGIRRSSFDIYYWVDVKDDVYKEGFVEMAPPHYLNSYPGVPSSCGNVERCANNHDGKGTFECRPGNEYQIRITFKYTYAVGGGIENPQILEVEAQEFCRY
jgi:RHS repeat-associated protein